jgi:hypothetical protein
MERTRIQISIKLCKTCLEKYMMINIKHLKKWGCIQEEQFYKFNKSHRKNPIDITIL